MCKICILVPIFSINHSLVQQMNILFTIRPVRNCCCFFFMSIRRVIRPRRIFDRRRFDRRNALLSEQILNSMCFRRGLDGRLKFLVTSQRYLFGVDFHDRMYVGGNISHWVKPGLVIYLYIGSTEFTSDLLHIHISSMLHGPISL